MSEHLLEMAKALVRVKDGKVEVLADPGISCCPLRRDLYGIHEESRETVERVARLVILNEYKRRQAAPGVRITPRAFGRDRRYPITSGFRR